MTVDLRGGSLRWMAPELVEALDVRDPNFTVETDIWAFGMTALVRPNRKFPHCDLQNIDSIRFRIIKAPPERPSGEDTCDRMTNEWWGLCSRCLRIKPSSRITQLVRQDALLTPEELERADEQSIEISTVAEEMEGAQKQLREFSVTDVHNSRPGGVLPQDVRKKTPLTKRLSSLMFWREDKGGRECYN